MEPVLDSEESSSGSESGWTLYLDDITSIDAHQYHSCKNPSPAHHHRHQEKEEEEEPDDDDDMSMVSDASSGPPHFDQQHHHEDEDEDENEDDDINGGVFCDPCDLVFGCRKRRKILVNQTGFCSLQDLPHAVLDDTASSPFFSFSNKDLTVCNKQGLMRDNENDDDTRFDYSQGHSTTYFEMV